MRVDVDGDPKTPLAKSLMKKRSFKQWKSFPGKGNNSFKGNFSSKKWNNELYSDILEIDGKPLPVHDEEAVGVITMEDVIEELLQVNIFIQFFNITSFLYKFDHISFSVCFRRKFSMRQITILMIRDKGLFEPESGAAWMMIVIYY